jgi:hypothetical protein
MLQLASLVAARFFAVREQMPASEDAGYNKF